MHKMCLGIRASTVQRFHLRPIWKITLLVSLTIMSIYVNHRNFSGRRTGGELWVLSWVPKQRWWRESNRKALTYASFNQLNLKLNDERPQCFYSSIKTAQPQQAHPLFCVKLCFSFYMVRKIEKSITRLNAGLFVKQGQQLYHGCCT